MNRIHATLIATTLALTGTRAAAATIAAWDMSGQPGDQAAMAATSSHAAVSGGNLSRGTGLNASGGGDSFSSSGWAGSEAGDYISFSFSVESGYLLELDALLIGTRSSNTGPGTVGLFSSLDGFTSSIGSIAQAGGSAIDSALDLSGLGALSGDLEFRLVEIGDTQADGVGNTTESGTFRVLDYFGGSDGIATQFTGMVVPQPVPLPASLWLFGSALCTLVCRRRTARS